ncbi:MAG: gluconokinase [Daejeonella sp.]|uniref:gluconokinase n=1 Tax=Daejeonella sp. TaxID=2805397 RepID=UPI003C778A75
MNYVLGVDIGTGSTKAVAVGYDSIAIGTSQYHYPTYSPQADYSEQNPELIWEAFKNCLQDTVDRMQGSPVAICLSSAMHSLIPVDRQGVKLMDMITWADCRSDSIATRLKHSAKGKHIYELSGMPVHAMSPLCKIIWLRENMPVVFEQAYKFISIKEYIWYRLFGEYVIDHSIAGATGMLDIGSFTWNSELLALAGIREDQLSQPVKTDYTPTLTSSLGGMLNNETAFYIGASDGCLANLGSFAIRKGVAAVTIGTSGAIRIASEKPIINTSAMTFSYCLDEKTFICGGPVNNGGNILDWLITGFLGKTNNKETFIEVFKMAEQVSPGAEGLLFLPYLNGERAPVWDASSSGAFIGIRSRHTQAHFCRAVLEGICFALYEVLWAVEDGSDGIEQINVSGGFVNSKTWMQLLADITGRRLALVQTEDASAIGAAFIALKALGMNGGKYPDEPGKATLFIEPDMVQHHLYSRNFAVYRNLYSSLKNSMHQLSTENN